MTPLAPIPAHGLLPWLGDRKTQATSALLRIRLEAEGFAPAKFAGGPMIIAANHRSLLDTVVVRYALPAAERRNTVTIGARDFFAPGPTDVGFRWLIRAATCAYITNVYRVCLIGRGDDMGDGVPVIQRALAAGQHVILFPEGTRARTSELGRFRMGVAHVAHLTGARVLPVWISGTDQVMPVGARWLRRGTIRMTAGEPIQIQAAESNGAFLDRMRKCLVSLQHAHPLDSRPHAESAREAATTR